MWTLTNNMIPAKTNSVDVRVTVPNDAQPGTLTNFRLLGHAEINDATTETPVSTFAAVKRLFPALLYPHRGLDGWMSVGITASKVSVEKPDEKADEP